MRLRAKQGTAAAPGGTGHAAGQGPRASQSSRLCSCSQTASTRAFHISRQVYIGTHSSAEHSAVQVSEIHPCHDICICCRTQEHRDVTNAALVMT